MSSRTPATATLSRWHEGRLVPIEYCESPSGELRVADSWLVSDGRTLALDLHRQRFARAAGEHPEFWEAVIAATPTDGDWFPRVELQDRGLAFRLRSAPERTRSVVVATFRGDDPRTAPTVKGPDLDAMARLRRSAQRHGAGEAIILSADGYLVEGAYSALLWWEGDVLCAPSPELPRIDSVTARSVLTLAAALGVETRAAHATPAELDGTEIWSLSALHGIRIVTSWIDGPACAEEPGRLESWRRRLSVLTRPVATVA